LTIHDALQQNRRIGVSHPKAAGSPEAYIPVKQLQADLVAARNALRDSDARFNTLADALPHMVWSTMPDGDHDYFNER
jgi:PAS domain-containing protein